MADKTKIEWVRSPDGSPGATWNPITGCMIKSLGCTNCYAMRLAGGRLQHHPSRAGLTREVNGHHVWTGETRFNEQWLDQPIKWKRSRNIFVAAHADLFYEAVELVHQVHIFHVMLTANHHRYQILTKRPDIAIERLRKLGVDPKPHIWIGTSVERQQEADERRPHLETLAKAGWNTWVSYEPALGPVHWAGWEFIRWMVSGGESGPSARPSHPIWHRTTRDWCAAHDIPYFFKQWGAWLAKSQRGGVIDGTTPWGTIQPDGYFWPTGRPWNGHDDDGPGAGAIMVRVGKKAAGSLLDGVEHKAMP